jgi:aminoglycoside phosphotransferase (APT) family kinase protein
MDVEREFHLLRYLHAHGIKIAAPILFVDANSPIKRSFFVSERVNGAPIGDFRLNLNSIAPQTIRDIANLLAQVHRLPIDLTDKHLSKSHLALNPPRHRADATRAFVQAMLDDRAAWGEPASPIVSTVARFLIEQAPGEDLTPVLVHGDCGPNNIMVENDNITALLDWEPSRLGDPVEDIAWLLFLTKGLIDPAEFVDLYVKSGGDPIDEFTLRYMTVLQRLKLLFVRDAVRSHYERFAHARPALAVAGYGYDERTVMALNVDLQAADAVRRRL